MTEVLWASSAQTDREEIFAYLLHEAGFNVAAAADEKFINMAEVLRNNPLAGLQRGKKVHQRKLVVPNFPFILVYFVAANEVHILRILHTARKIAATFQA